MFEFFTFTFLLNLILMIIHFRFIYLIGFVVSLIFMVLLNNEKQEKEKEESQEETTSKIFHTFASLPIELNDKGIEVFNNLKQEEPIINGIFGDSAKTLAEELFYKTGDIVLKYLYPTYQAKVEIEDNHYNIYFNDELIGIAKRLNKADEILKVDHTEVIQVKGGKGKVMMRGIERYWFEYEDYEYQLFINIREA